jgi:hypothetical protein
MSGDLTEAIRRQLIPDVNRPATEALRAAGKQLVDELGADTVVTDDTAATIIKRRDDEAKKLLREKLVAEHGADNVFDTEQLSEHFEVLGFMAPCVVVIRKSDNKKGSLFFTHNPRLYYDFTIDTR